MPDDRIREFGDHKFVIAWQRVLFVAVFYTVAFVIFPTQFVYTEFKYQSFLFTTFMAVVPGVAIVAGPHRLWSHRSYKAKKPFRVLLMILYCAANQSDIMNWARDHRMHHKYSDTNADPHNPLRGFFFSHNGWPMVRRHPDFNKTVKKLDLSDLEKDPVVVFQRKYHRRLALLLCYILPTLIPYYFWQEPLRVSFINAIFAHIIRMQMTFMINSVAHKFGERPYLKNCSASDSDIASFLMIVAGEGKHNYHHAFPWDYRSMPTGTWIGNWPTMVVDIASWIGQTYDLKYATPAMVEKRKRQAGLED